MSLKNLLKNQSEKCFFDSSVTNCAKGIAILLMLYHHLFYKNMDYGQFIYSTALLAKVCVTMFVVLSGYGLTVSVKQQSLGEFYRKRYAKLYLNYWVIMLIFIPVSCIFFNNSVYRVFTGGTLAVWGKFFLQILGLNMYCGEMGFNGTWWFMSAIVTLYMVFPLLYRALPGKAGTFADGRIFIAVAIAALLQTFQTFNGFALLLPFVGGMLAGHYNIFNRLFYGNIKLRYQFLLIAGAMILHLLLYNILRELSYMSLTLALLGIAIYLHKIKISAAILGIFGKHSMNIFLFHSFIYHQFFPKFFYSLPSPIVMIVVLAAVSLGISMLIELLKKITGFYRLQNWICSGK